MELLKGRLTRSVSTYIHRLCKCIEYNTSRCERVNYISHYKVCTFIIVTVPELQLRFLSLNVVIIQDRENPFMLDRLRGQREPINVG